MALQVVTAHMTSADTQNIIAQAEQGGPAFILSTNIEFKACFM